jgi:hypothetical protein
MSGRIAIFGSGPDEIEAVERGRLQPLTADKGGDS